jgi:hypothetical protein
VGVPVSPVAAGKWMVLEIIAAGKRILVKVDGKVTADYTDESPSYLPSGRVALLQHRPQSLVEFRKIEVREFNRPGEVAAELLNASPPLTGRSAFQTFNGQWRVEGDEVVQADQNAFNCYLSFGDKKWTDYDFTVDAMRVSGNDCFSLLFRCHDQGNHIKFTVSGHGNKLTYMEPHYRGKPAIPKWTELRVETGKWYTARVKVRGKHYTCYLRDHDAETDRKLFELDDDRLPNGCVGLFTWTSIYRFKNIKVTSPDGKILWEGAPALGPRVP